MHEELEKREDTYILDPENAAEMARLEIQGQLLAKGMGGILPESNNLLPEGCLRVLDLACGPGEWVLQVAQQNPKVEVTGLDISNLMIAYAQVRAQEQSLTSARFYQGNVLKPLDFPDGYFDLVNARALIAVLHQHHWPTFVQECVRITRPGGLIRLTEGDDMGRTNSLAHERLQFWLQELLRRNGYGFSPFGGSAHMTPMLGKLLEDAGCNRVSYHPYALNFSSGTELSVSQRQNYRVFYKQAEPLILQAGITTREEFEETYARMLDEGAISSFRGLWIFVTAIGTKA